MALTPEEISKIEQVRKQNYQASVQQGFEKFLPGKGMSAQTTPTKVSPPKTDIEEPSILQKFITGAVLFGGTVGIKKYFGEKFGLYEEEPVDFTIESKNARYAALNKSKEQEALEQEDISKKQIENTRDIYNTQKGFVTSDTYFENNPEFSAKAASIYSTPEGGIFNQINASLDVNRKQQYDALVNQEINNNLTKLGYTWHSEKNEVSQPYLKKDEDYIPDNEWLENNRKIAFNYTKQKENAEEELINIFYDIDAMRNLVRLPGSAGKWVSDNIPGAKLLDSPETYAFKSSTREDYKKENDLLLSTYTAPLITQTTKSDKLKALSEVDYDNPNSFNLISDETNAINSLIPKNDAEKQDQKLGFLKSGIILNTYSNPAFSDDEINKYVTLQGKDTPESQKYYASMLDLEINSMTDGMKVYRSNLDQIYKNINNLQTNINKYGYQKDWKEQLDKNILLKDNLKKNIDARYDALNYWNQEKNSLSLYKDTIIQQKRLDKLSRISPGENVLLEFGQRLFNVVPAVTGALSNIVVSATYSDADKEKFAMDKLRSSENSDMSFVGGLISGKKLGSEQTAEGLVYDETAEDWIMGSKINASPIGLYNKRGEIDFYINPTAITFATAKVAFDSYMMGGAMFGASKAFAPIYEGIAEARIAGAAAALTKTESLLNTINYGSRAAATSVAETFVGSMAPSYLMYGDEMLKEELKQGLSFDQALAISSIRAGIEGLTERIFPNDMAWYKQLAGKGAIKTYAELTAKKGYVDLINRAVEKSFGKRLTYGAYNQIFKPAVLPLLEEGSEEVIGLGLNEIPNLMAKKMKYDYQPSEEWSPEAAINVMVSTAATMLPMGYNSVRTSRREYSGNQKAAQYAVGQTPSLYIKAVEDLYDKKSISREEADRRLNFVGKLANIASGVEEDLASIEDIEKYTDDQRQQLGYEAFTIQAEKENLKGRLIQAPTEEEKLQIAQMYDNEEAKLSKLLERGLFKNDAERVENSKNNTEFYLNDSAINTNTNKKGLLGIAANLKKYAATETDKSLIDLYNSKVEKIEKRVKDIDAGILSVEELKIEEAKKAEAKKAENIVTIKSRDKKNNIVDNNLIIGKEYVLGRTLQIKDGKVIFNYPVFKVIGKNEDGTITIQTKNSKGELIHKNVPTDYLSSYKIASKEAMDKLPAGDPGKIYLKWGDRKVKYYIGSQQQVKLKLIPYSKKDYAGYGKGMQKEGYLSYEDGVLYFNFLHEEEKNGKITNVPKKLALDKEGAKKIKGVSKKFGNVIKANPGPNQSEEMTSEDFEKYHLGDDFDRDQLEKELDEIDNAELERQREEKKNTFYKVFEAYLLKLREPLTKLEAKLSSLKTKTETLSKNIELLSKIKEDRIATKEELEKIFTTRAEKALITLLFKTKDNSLLKRKIVVLANDKINKSIKELEKIKEDVRQTTYDIEVQTELFKEKEEEFKSLFDDEDEESGKDAYEVLSERKSLIQKGLRKNKALLKTLNNSLNQVNALIDLATQALRNLTNEFLSKFPGLSEMPPISSIKEDDSEEFKKAIIAYNRRMEGALRQADEDFDYEILEINAENFEKQIKETSLAIEQATAELKDLNALLKNLKTEKEKLDKQNTILKKQEILKAILGESVAESSESGVDDTKETKETESTEKEPSKKSIFQWFSSTISGNIESYAKYWNDNTNNFAARRLHYFLNNIENNEDIQLLFVTAKSVPDNLKEVIYSKDGVYDPNDIKVIFVKIVNGQRKFIDAKGGILEGDKINANNVVYTSLPSEDTASSITWANGERSVRDKDLEDYEEEDRTKIIDDTRKSFIDLRNKVLASSEPMDFTIDSISNGIPNKKEGVVLENGDIEFQRTPVQGSLLADGTVNLNNTKVIEIGTKPDENGLTPVQVNGTLVNVPVGKPFINWGSKFAFLNNRKFSKKEVDKLVDLVFILYTKAKLNAIKQGESPNEKVKILDLNIINYLKKVVFWKNPAVGTKVTTPSVNQMWLDGEGLHIGDAIIAFTPEEFEENQEATRLALETFFENAYHTVDNKNLTNVSFSEITEVYSDKFTKNGKIDFKKLEKLINENKDTKNLYEESVWGSYQSYLISNKNSDGKGTRSSEEIPLTTSLKEMPTLEELLQPLSEEELEKNPVNIPLIAKYVTFNYEGKPAMPEKKSKPAKTTKTTKTGKAAETSKTTETTDTEKSLPDKEELLENAYDLVSNLDPKKNPPWKKALLKKAYESFFNLKEGVYNLYFNDIDSDEKKLIAKVNVKIGDKYFDIEQIEIHDEELSAKYNDDFYKKTVDFEGPVGYTVSFEKAEEAPSEQPPSEEPESTDTEAETETDTKSKTPTEEKDFTEGDVLMDLFSSTDTSEKTDDTKETPPIKKTPPTDDTDETDTFRIAKPGVYTLENIEAAKAWLAQVMPQISFKDVVGLIDGVAWGKFVKNGIILSNLAEIGTIFHEAFEAVVGVFLNNREWNTIKRQFRNRLGSFVERETGKIIKYSEATDKQVVEEVSEEYREFGLTGKKWVGEAKKNNLFRRMRDTINAFLFGDAKTIEEVFERISNAYYADKKMLPVARNFGIKPNYRIADMEESQFYYDVNQSITHTLLTTIASKNISVYDLLEGNVSVKDIYFEVLKKINLEIAPTKELIQLYDKNDKDWLKAIKESKSPLPSGLEGNEEDVNKIEAAIFINRNWKQLVDANLETLRKKYNILIDQETEESENQDITNDEGYEEGALTPEEEKEGKSRNDYTFSDFEVDVKKNAAAAVKLMIATLGQRVLVEGFNAEGLPKTKLLRNSIGLYMPVDFYKTFNNLLNIMTSPDVAVTNFDEFMEALKNNIAAHPEFYSLYYRLKFDNPKNLTPKEHRLKLDFTKTFNKLKVGFTRQIVTKQEVDRDTKEVKKHSSVNVIDSKQNSEVRVIKEGWFSNINTNKDDKTLYKIEEGNYKILPNAFDEYQYQLNTSELNKNVENAYKIAERLGLTTNLDLKKLKKEEKLDYVRIINNIKSFIKSGDALIILGKDTNFIGSINDLAEFEHKHLKNSVELNHLNIDGKLQNDITGLNTFGIIIKDILASKSLEEIMQRNPHLKDIGVRLSAWKNMIFDEVTNKKIGKIVIKATEGLQFDREKEGKDNSKLDLATKFMSEFNDNLKGFYHIFVTADSKTEWLYSFINSQNKTTPFTNQTNIKYIYKEFFRNYLKNEILLARDFYTNAERRRVAELQKEMNTPFSKKRQKGISLGFFDSILSSDLVYSEVVDLKLKNNSVESQDKMVDTWLDLNEDLILEDLEKFIDNMSTETKQFMKENGIISGNTINLLEVDTGKANNNTFTEASMDELIKLRQINYMINMFEQFNMFWGSPNQFSDATKRIKSFASTREAMSYDEKQLDVSSAFDEYANANFNIVSGEENEAVNLTENDRGFQNHDGTLTSLVLEDVKVVLNDVESFTKHVLNEHSKSLFNRSLNEISEYMLEYLKDKFKYFIDPYYDIDETDGQAVMTLPAYRQFLRRAVMWTTQMEEQYQYEMAYERLAINKYKNEALKEIDKYLVEVKGNPNTQNLSKGKEFNVFPVLKPIGAGYKSGDIFITSLDKMSVVPLFYRALEGRKGLEIYNYLQDNKIGYARYESANKVGKMTSPVEVGEEGKIRSIYNPDGTMNTEGAPNTDTLLYKYFAIQVETSGQKTYTTRGSQVTKTSVSNLTIAGLPIDLINPIVKEAIQNAIDSGILQNPIDLKKKDIEKYLADSKKIEKEAIQSAVDKYSKLSPEELESISPIQKVINQHNNSLYYLTQIGKEELFKKYNIKEKDGTYQITNVKKFVELIKKELDQRDTPKNIVDAIKASPNENELEVPVDMIVGGEKLESLLMSVIDKSIASPKFLGGGKPQVASTLFEKNKRNLVMKTDEGWVKVKDYNKLTPKEKESVKISSNELHFYTPEKPWIEVLLPYKYKDLIAKSLDKNGEIDKELLKMIGFRIPNQSLNSTENIRVKGFLPESYGDMIVVPSAITAKAGSDFDIDKLNMYMFNYFFDKNGIAKKIEFLDESNSTVKERYNRYVMDKASRDEIDYINYLSSAEFEKIKDEFANQLTTIKNNLFNLRKLSVGEQRDIYLNSLEDSKDITKTERKGYNDELSFIGRSLFRDLNEDLKQQLRDNHRNHLLNRVKGAAAITSHRDLVSDMLLEKEYSNEDEKNTLISMIDIYDQQLKLYGRGSIFNLFYQKEKEEALKKFREGKDIVKSEYMIKYQKQKDTLSYVKSLAKSTLNDEKIAELAKIIDLESQEDFKDLPIELQNTKKALENRYVETLMQIIELPENFKQLVTPNSAKILSDRAERIRDLKGEEKESKSNGNFLNPVFTNRTRYSFQIGKDAIGIAAIGITNHALNQLWNVYLKSNNVERQEKLNRFTVLFPTNSITITKEDGTVEKVSSLSFILDDEGNWISDNLSAFANAYVDVAKDPFIFSLNGNMTTAGPYATANKLGIGINKLTLLFTQPIVEDYIKLEERRKGMLGKAIGMTRSDVDSIIEAKYGIDRTEQEEAITEGELENMIKTKYNDLTEDQKKLQVSLLDSYKLINDINNDIRDFVGSYNYDTSNIGNVSAVDLKKHAQQQTKMKVAKGESFVQGSVPEKSFFREIDKSYSEYVQAISSLFFTKSVAGQQTLNPIFLRLYDIFDSNEREKAINNVKKGYINYLFLKTPVTLVINDKEVNLTIGNYYNKLLIEKGNTAEVLRKIQKDVKNGKIKKSVILDKLFAMVATEERKTNNLKMHDRIKEAEYSDMITNSLEALKDNSLTKRLGNLLNLTSLVQSGLGMSKISYSQYLSNKNFISIIAKQIKNNILIDQKDFLSLFYANSWQNETLTPKVKNYKNKTYSAGFLFGEGAKEALEKQGYKDTYSYVALDLYNKQGKINNFGANPLKSFQIKKIEPVYNKITKEMEFVTKIFQQVVDEQGNPILFNQKTENFMVDGKIKTGVNAKVIYKEVQRRGNGQYGMEYGNEAVNFPKVETIPNNVLISLRTAGFNMTLDQILQQSFEDIIESETTIPTISKKVKPNLDKKLVNYINSLVPNYIKTNSDKIRIVSELASMFMLSQDFQTNEELLKNSQDVEKMIKALTPQQLKEEDKDTIDNMIANAIIEKLAKDGLSEKDIYDNFFGKNNANLKPTSSTQSSTSLKGFQGYKGKFEDKGKGTPEGDGKDKAMRKVATGSIVEFKTDKVKSSSLTTFETVGKDNAYSYEKDRYVGQSYNGVKDFKNDYGSVVMLARNGKLAGTELSVDTKVEIKTAHNQGAEFVVGDMPGVDSQFIDYLQEIGAKFTIYHTGNTSRIQVKPTTTTKLSTSVKPKSLGDIKLNIIEDWVQSGQATTTVRSSSYHNSFYKGDGIYTTDKGNLVNITYKGLVKLKDDKIVGNGFSYTKDKFAKAEGFGTWANFQKNAKYAGKTLIDGGSVHLYNITTKSKINQNKPDGLPPIGRTPENCQ